MEGLGGGCVRVAWFYLTDIGNHYNKNEMNDEIGEKISGYPDIFNSLV